MLAADARNSDRCRDAERDTVETTVVVRAVMERPR
jgi:hypothetical protein